ncbi:hypothetical protein [Sphaerisporangium aureirubrum]|uniref:Peptidoglycan-binding protein n=1 Tax=Sphaerisporangium aureirubrum TaxID=1544736 RepID=A0ABW1NTL4_9ACTN
MSERGERDGDGVGESGRQWRRVVVGVGVLVVIGGAGAGAVGLARYQAPVPVTAGRVPVETVTVVRTDLADTRSLPGALGFGAERVVRGAGEGVVTRLPKPGAPVSRGRALYWVNDRPVRVFFGDTPLFRTLGKIGVQGRDVTVVAANLRALGYDPGPASAAASVPRNRPALPGEVFTAGVRSALKRWQLDAGLSPTGTLRPGQIAVLPGAARIGVVKAALGDPVAADLMTITRVTKVVTVPVDATDVGTIRRGDRVTVTLPSTKRISATVTSVARTTTEGPSDGSGGSGTPQVTVTATPRRAKDVRSLDSAAVQVDFTTERHKAVLAVPVSALLALREGGYALQLPGGKLVAAETGLFARGMVEVGGPGITEGLTVVTSS